MKDKLDAINKVKIIGVPISIVNQNIVLDFISANIDKLKGQYICAANAHTTVMAYENKEYLDIQSNSILALPDGKPLSVIGKLKGFKMMEKVSGPSFMEGIFEDKRFEKYRHYFYGSTSENLELLIENVKQKYPNLKISGFEPSVFRELSNDEMQDLINRINKSNTDFLWIGIGAPRQEKLMFNMKGKVNCIMTGVGGAFNILSGKVKAAPKWMQKVGLEWFYRFIKEPRRLCKRYLITNTKFIWYQIKDKVKKEGK